MPSIYDTTFLGLSAGSFTVPPFTPTPDSSKPRYEALSKTSLRAGTPKPRPISKCTLPDAYAEDSAKDSEAVERAGTQRHEHVIGKLDLKCRKLEHKAMEKQHQRECKHEQHQFCMMQMQLMISQNPQAAASAMMQSRDPTSQVLPNSASLEEEALTLERRGHTGCLSLLSFGFDSCLMMCCAIDSWTDSVTRRPYAIDPALLDVDA
jgi:hypothetical protein